MYLHIIEFIHASGLVRNFDWYFQLFIDFFVILILMKRWIERRMRKCDIQVDCLSGPRLHKKVQPSNSFPRKVILENKSR